MKLDVFDSFVTAVLASRLEKSTAREWRKYSDGAEGIPPYSELLKYIDLQACDGEEDSQEDRKRPTSTAGKKGRGKPCMPLPQAMVRVLVVRLVSETIMSYPDAGFFRGSCFPERWT